MVTATAMATAKITTMVKVDMEVVAIMNHIATRMGGLVIPTAKVQHTTIEQMVSRKQLHWIIGKVVATYIFVRNH